MVAGEYIVLEVNGAVDVTTKYSLLGREVFDQVAELLYADTNTYAIGSAELSD